MLRASALYIVIVIALVIGILCSSLIAMAYFYRLQYQKTFRQGQLQNNLASGINILAVSADTGYSIPHQFSLFNQGTDSVSLQRLTWGLIDIGIVKAFIQQDTLYKVFSLANTIDSTKWAAIYLDDNSRSLSISGHTSIVGDAYLSPAGINQAYVDNQSYTGDKLLVSGKKYISSKHLPGLDSLRLHSLELLSKLKSRNTYGLSYSDSLSNSFLLPTKVINLGAAASLPKHSKFIGNVILLSDTSLTIDSSVELDQVIIVAKAITVKRGFHGRCQLFAHNTIDVRPNCVFNYPSALAVIRFDPANIIGKVSRMSLDSGVIFNGYIFNYEKNAGSLPAVISLDKNVVIKGQVYSQGFVEIQNKAEVDGSIFTDRFLYQTTFTRYENYIVNAIINQKLLSSYFLSSPLFPVASKSKKILQWLEGN